MNLLSKCTIIFCFLSVSQFAYAQLHTFQNSESIENIDVQVVYYIPKDVEPLADWKERITYHMKRAESFHKRELSNQSELNLNLMPQPFVSKNKRAEFPKDDPNKFFWEILNEVSDSDEVKFADGAFPILLVMSDHNFSPSYNDWTRVCNGKNCVFVAPHEQCKGHVSSDGDHRPGSRCGGARAVYWPERHQGFGLVTADGWRVPIKGTDCVFYHEGIGHSIGLPHPDPNDDSVMGTAQYVGPINETWINMSQKKDDLFSTYSIGHHPVSPSPDEPVEFYAKLPEHFEVATIQCEYQTSLQEPFKKFDNYTKEIINDYQIFKWKHSGVKADSSLAYRIKVELTDGTEEMIWHYVKASSD